MSIEFKIKKSERIDGVMIIEPSVSSDSRGTLWTSYRDIDNILPNSLKFVHDKFSESKKNVLRGIHGDDKTWKLVTSVYGEIYQVVVDNRKSSPTYMQWEKFIINKDHQSLILVPPGVGNAYYVLSEHAVYHYKLSYVGKYNDVNKQFTLRWDDVNLNIDWPIDTPILSSRDSI
jgi:dTDP-4-dehydrorhamnose 3,5-epimerase